MNSTTISTVDVSGYYRGTNSGWYEDALVQQPTKSDVIVTPLNILGNPIVWQAVNTIAGDIGQIPIHKINSRPVGGDEIETKRDASHWIDQLLNVKPNRYQTPRLWKECVMRDVLLYGNHCSAAIEVDGEPMLLPLDPSLTWYERDSTDPQDFFISTTLGQKTFKLAQEYVVHVPWLVDLRNFWGFPPTQLLAEALGVGLSMQEQVGATFANQARPGGVLHSDNPFNEEAAKNLRREWDNLHRGQSNSGKIAVLWEGLRYMPVQMTNSDAQVVDLRKLDRDLVASIYNLPSWKVNSWEDVSAKATVEESQRAYFATTLQRWTNAIKEELERKLFTMTQLRTQRTYLEWDVSSYDYVSTEERYKAYEIGIVNRIISPNEARRQEGLNPYDGGEEFYNPQPGGGNPEQEGSDESVEAGEPAEEDRTEEARAAVRKLVHAQLGALLRTEAAAIRSAANKQPDFISWLEGFFASYQQRAETYLAGACGVAELLGYQGDWQSAISDYVADSKSFWLDVADKCQSLEALRIHAAEAPVVLESAVQPLTSRILEPETWQKNQTFISTT